MLCDANYVDERSIQIRFNKLCRQFGKNPKYMSLGNDLIPDDEDISYEISVNNKRYQAIYYRLPAELSDTTLLREKLWPIMLEKYMAEDIENPTENLKNELMTMFMEYMIELCSKKSVWFMIPDFYGK